MRCKVRQSMRPVSLLLVVFAMLISVAAGRAPGAFAQKDHNDPLTEAQVEKIREAGIEPNQRVKLYTEYLNDHIVTVKSLSIRRKSDARASHLDRELHDVATLIDELGSNL